MEKLGNISPFFLIIQIIIFLSVIALFVSIIVDFLLYSEKKPGEKERRSIVATGTMTGFFFIYYFVLASRFGVIPVESSTVKNICIVLGTIAIAIGSVLNIRGRFDLGKNWANHIKIYKEHTIVKRGMYRFVRHPLYATIIMMFYGGCLVYRNIAAFLAVSLIFVPFMVYRAKQEEEELKKRFSDYEEYSKSTGMLFPRIIKKR